MSIFSRYVKKQYKKAKKHWDRSDLGKAGGKVVKSAAEIAEANKKAFGQAYSALSDSQKSVYDNAISAINKIGEDARKGDFGKGITQLKEGVSKKVELAKETVKRSDLGSGAAEKAVKRSDWGKMSNRFNRGARGTYRGMTNTIYQSGKRAERARASAARSFNNRYQALRASAQRRYESIGRQARAARDHAGKQLSTSTLRNFSLKRSIRGTASGASEMYRRGDFGKTMRYLGKRTGYTGSDFDKTMQKAEKEGANIVNQTVDFIDSPGKVILSNVKKADQYIKDRLGINIPTSQELLTKGILAVGKSLQPKGTPKGGPSSSTNIGGPGGGRTIGQGNLEGLQGGGQLSASKRSRTRQNKRNLRIARA